MRSVGFTLAFAVVVVGFVVAVAHGFGVSEYETVTPQVAGASTTRELPTTGLLAAVNNSRIAAGVNPIEEDAELMQVAKMRLSDMITRQYYAHENPEGRTYDYFLESFQKYSCENLDLTRDNSETVVIRDWLASSAGHRQCLLNSSADVAGFAAGEYADNYLTVLILADR